MREFFKQLLYLLLTAIGMAAFVYIIITYTHPVVWMLSVIMIMLGQLWWESRDSV